MQSSDQQIEFFCVLDMGLFSCCTSNVVDNVITEDISEEKVQNRKVTSASSKESKDSGE